MVFGNKSNINGFRKSFKDMDESDVDYEREKLRYNFSVKANWTGKKENKQIQRILEFKTPMSNNSVITILNVWLERNEKQHDYTKVAIKYIGSSALFKDKFGEPIVDVSGLIQKATLRTIKFAVVYICCGIMKISLSDLNEANLDYYARQTIKILRG